MMGGRLGSRSTKSTQWRVGQRLPQSQLAGRSRRARRSPNSPGLLALVGSPSLGFLANRPSVNGRLCCVRASVALWPLEQISGTCHAHSAVVPRWTARPRYNGRDGGTLGCGDFQPIFHITDLFLPDITEPHH